MGLENSFFQKYKPGVPKRYLLFFAAFIWTFAGGMLLFRGFYFLSNLSETIWSYSFVSILAGLIFYILVFSHVSLKHSLRIVNLSEERPSYNFV